MRDTYQKNDKIWGSRQYLKIDIRATESLIPYNNAKLD